MAKIYSCHPGKRVRSFTPKPIATVAQRMIAEQMLEMEKPVKIPLLRKGVDVVFDCTRL